MQSVTERHQPFIVETVRKYYEKHNRPILLSDLGTLFTHEFGRFSSYYATNLRRYLQEHLSGELAVVSHPEILQKIYVAPIENAAAATQFATSISPPTDSDAPTSADTESIHLPNLQRAVLMAFQITPEPSENVYITSSPPFRFVVRSEPLAPSDDLIPIEPEFSLKLPRPKHLTELDEEEERQIQHNITRWAEKHRVPVQRFYFSRRTNQPVPSGSAQEEVTALDRLIGGQSEDIRRKLLIPADIIKYLMKLR